MAVIKVWCLPKLSERKLRKIHKSIVKSVERVKELGLKGEESMTVLFPKDAMKYGLGTEIIIEVTGLPAGSWAIYSQLAENVGLGVKKFFSKTKVGCSVSPYDPGQVLWSSN